MFVGVGYSENPDTTLAGIQAAESALAQVSRRDPDLALLFATARHDARVLWDAVVSVVGSKTKIVGGGAVGVMTNHRFGYAGDQVGIAVFWLESGAYGLASEEGLVSGNEAFVGYRLGRRLADLGLDADSSVMLFYDAIDREHGDLRLVMATPMLAGIEKALGFLPNLLGAGLQGDYGCTPTDQWVGDGVSTHNAIALTFSEGLRIDSAIMHGCRPATGYYTVTKADQQTILEIDHQPALTFMDGLLGSGIAPDSYPFFLILGVNSGDKWGEFDENNYASRLCLGIDKARDGIVMFEPDMVEGTQFQIMYRGINLEYMRPKITALFDQLQDRKPVFAFYIDCAGRAAGYAGMDLEDAVLIQEVIGDRVPFLGIYSGVEIGPVTGRSRALDWTGVLCLFSVRS